MTVPAPPSDPELDKLLSLSAVRTKRDYRRMARLSARLARTQGRDSIEWGDADTAELEALLAQYVSLREESMNTINNRVQILLLGIAAVGALLGGALTIDDPVSQPILVLAVFSVAVPLATIFVLLVWVSEAVRSHRVSYFLAADTEARVNAKLGRFVMGWEACLWAGTMPRDELFGPSMMAMAVLGLIGLASPFCGLVLTGTPLTLEGLVNIATLLSASIVIPGALFGASFGYVLLNWRRLKNIEVIVSTLADPNLEEADSPEGLA